MIALAFTVCACSRTKQKAVVVQEFELSGMLAYVEVYPWSENIGPIANGEEAVEKAQEIWLREFYARYNIENPWEDGTQIAVYYDKSSDCWYLTEDLPEDTVGTVAHLIVRSDGEVLALWHEGLLPDSKITWKD